MTGEAANSSANNNNNNNGNGSGVLFEDQVPKTMVEALETEDPYQALLALAQHAQQKAQGLSTELTQEFGAFVAVELPDLLKQLPNTQDADSHPVSTAIACSDSILHSLTKIASGGSQASQEIKQLENEKRDLEEHTQDVETALILRQASDMGAQSLSAQRYEQAAQAMESYLQQRDSSRLTDRAKAYAGEYTITQLETTLQNLKATLLEHYQQAVAEDNLENMGKLTPLVQKVQMESDAVSLYLRFLKGLLKNQLQAAANSANTQQDPKQKNKPTPPHVPMAKVYNAAVNTLRHHLPMVSHCLHRADGDAAVVQLVHVQVEQVVGPLLDAYQQSRQLGTCSNNAQVVYQNLEDRYSGRGDVLGFLAKEEEDGDNYDDCGFSTQVGSLSDVDAAMEECALCLQHAESYTRFINHTVNEVNKARSIRFQQAQEEKRMERERKAWATGMSSPQANATASQPEEEEDMDYQPLEILPAHTQLQETVAEIGGYYSVIERCLLLASMQRAFCVPVDDPRQYSPLGVKAQNRPGVVGHLAVQTSTVESCLYAARRGTQRAFATGHTGTASAVANYCADCLRGVLVEYLARRAEEWGVSALKPGEGLLTGSGSIIHATTNLMLRQTGQVGGAGGSASVDEALRQKEIQQGIAWACATINDLDVAAQHTTELEKILSQGVDRGFPKNSHETEHLRLCVKSFAPVAEVFKASSQQSIESLVGVLKTRIRAIVTDAVGGDHASTGTAAFSSVMGGSKATDRHTVRMNYDLDEDAYHLLEVSEGYISRLCSCLDELILPLCSHLAPRLSDDLVLGVLGTVAKRLEVSLKKCRFTALGALSLDSDMRDLFNYAKERVDSHELTSNMALYRACTPLSRLVQIAKLMNVDDLEDVLDLISSSKRKSTWDLSMEDAKAYLSLRIEFESDKINNLLRMSDGD